MAKKQENITYKRDKRSGLSQQTRNTNNKKDPQSTALERSARKLLEGFNIFDGTKSTFISDVDLDKLAFGSHEDQQSWVSCLSEKTVAWSHCK